MKEFILTPPEGCDTDDLECIEKRIEEAEQAGENVRIGNETTLCGLDLEDNVF